MDIVREIFMEWGESGKEPTNEQIEEQLDKYNKNKNQHFINHIFRENGHFRLQPENDTMEPIILDNVEVLGKVIGLKRYY